MYLFGMRTIGFARGMTKTLSKNRRGRMMHMVRDKVARLEEENSALTRENRNLWYENKNLKSKLRDLEASRDTLGRISTRMLVALARYKGSGKGNITDTQLIKLVKLSIPVGKRHFEDLKTRRFVNSDGAIPGESEFWYVTSRGRGYLVNKGLI